MFDNNGLITIKKFCVAAIQPFVVSIKTFFKSYVDEIESKMDELHARMSHLEEGALSTDGRTVINLIRPPSVTDFLNIINADSEAQSENNETVDH
jgi:hypothetical protein